MGRLGSEGGAEHCSGCEHFSFPARFTVIPGRAALPPRTAELLVGCSGGWGLFHSELSTFCEAPTHGSCVSPSSLEAPSPGGLSQGLSGSRAFALLTRPWDVCSETPTPRTSHSSLQDTALGPHLNSGPSPLRAPHSTDVRRNFWSPELPCVLCVVWAGLPHPTVLGQRPEKPRFPVGKATWTACLLSKRKLCFCQETAVTERTHHLRASTPSSDKEG